MYTDQLLEKYDFIEKLMHLFQKQKRTSLFPAPPLAEVRTQRKNRESFSNM